MFVNAVKYSKKDEKSRIWIKIGFGKEKNKYYLSISDNGVGVYTSDFPFIFDKGFTGDNSDRTQSTGIGLYLVKKLCEELNIEISARSKRTEGFEIKFWLPVIEKK
ncbi:MAG: hypothetical protein LBR30_00775 [Clostridioides sp.]|nr:hypothetical protein [Clostridioides sp.]